MSNEIIEIDMTKFDQKMDKLPEEVEKEARICLRESAQIIIDESRIEFTEHFKGHTGKGEQAIQIDKSKTTNDSITVGLNDDVAPYVKYLHEGTGIYGKGSGAYWVEPLTKKALHWVSGGESFFSKGHYVNGIPAFPFLYRAAAKVKQKIIEHFQFRINEAMKKAGY